MDFGKLGNIEGVDFTLPPDHAGVGKVLGGTKAAHVKVYVGAPVWADEGFVGKIYPAKAKSKDYVKYYGAQFNSIELNSSHYRVPDEDTIHKWTGMVPGGFRFSPKIHQGISHAPALIPVIPQMTDLLKQLALFREHLGMSFMQLPPHFGTSRLDELLTFLDAVMARHMALELRHESWFKDCDEMKHLCNYLYKNKLCLNITDVAGRRDVLHQRLTCKTAFIRFTANDLHPTDFTRMDAWVQRLATWIELGLEELYFFIHTPTKGLTPELAIYFIREFNKRTGLKLEAPKLLATQQEPGTLF